MNRAGLAARWRPRRFADVVGQSHITTVLKNAVTRKRTNGAFLLVGTRGTGKTSTARIMAKATVCQDNAAGEPCEQCAECAKVDNETTTSLTEIDAASNRTTEQATALRDAMRENAMTNERQVHILDEVHMMTAPARAVLREAIERLPENATMILCTTEAEALDDPLKSRCQPHRFRRLRNQAVMMRLAEICLSEKIDHEDAALRLIAHAAGGSLRDAITILEQVAAGQDGPVDAAAVEATIGGHFRQTVLLMVRHMLDNRPDRAVSSLSTAADDGAEPGQIHQQARTLLNDALAVTWGLANAEDLPQTTRVSLQDCRWQRVITVQNAWMNARPMADERDTRRLERAIATACEPIGVGLFK